MEQETLQRSECRKRRFSQSRTGNRSAAVLERQYNKCRTEREIDSHSIFAVQTQNDAALVPLQPGPTVFLAVILLMICGNCLFAAYPIKRVLLKLGSLEWETPLMRNYTFNMILAFAITTNILMTVPSIMLTKLLGSCTICTSGFVLYSIACYVICHHFYGFSVLLGITLIGIATSFVYHGLSIHAQMFRAARLEVFVLACFAFAESFAVMLPNLLANLIEADPNLRPTQRFIVPIMILFLGVVSSFFLPNAAALVAADSEISADDQLRLEATEGDLLSYWKLLVLDRRTYSSLRKDLIIRDEDEEEQPTESEEETRGRERITETTRNLLHDNQHLHHYDNNNNNNDDEDDDNDEWESLIEEPNGRNQPIMDGRYESHKRDEVEISRKRRSGRRRAAAAEGGGGATNRRRKRLAAAAKRGRGVEGEEPVPLESLLFSTEIDDREIRIKYDYSDIDDYEDAINISAVTAAAAAATIEKSSTEDKVHRQSRPSTSTSTSISISMFSCKALTSQFLLINLCLSWCQFYCLDYLLTSFEIIKHHAKSQGIAKYYEALFDLSLPLGQFILFYSLNVNFPNVTLSWKALSAVQFLMCLAALVSAILSKFSLLSAQLASFILVALLCALLHSFPIAFVSFLSGNRNFYFMYGITTLYRASACIVWIVWQDFFCVQLKMEIQTKASYLMRFAFCFCLLSLVLMFMKYNPSEMELPDSYDVDDEGNIREGNLRKLINHNTSNRNRSSVYHHHHHHHQQQQQHYQYRNRYRNSLKAIRATVLSIHSIPDDILLFEKGRIQVRRSTGASLSGLAAAAGSEKEEEEEDEQHSGMAATVEVEGEARRKTLSCKQKRSRSVCFEKMDVFGREWFF